MTSIAATWGKYHANIRKFCCVGLENVIVYPIHNVVSCTKSFTGAVFCYNLSMVMWAALLSWAGRWWLKDTDAAVSQHWMMYLCPTANCLIF